MRMRKCTMINKWKMKNEEDEGETVNANEN